MVIALTVVIIISIGTISLMKASTQSLRRATYNVQAQNFAADVISCYRVGELSDNFEDEKVVIRSKKSISFAGGENVEQTNEGYACALPDSGYVASIEIDATTSTVTVKVYNPSNTTLVAEESFTKGGTLQ